MKNVIQKVKELLKSLFNTPMSSLDELKNEWEDVPEFHKAINEGFSNCVNSIPQLKAHRDWVEQNGFGFGERSFLWMWWLIIDKMPDEFSFMEIGVYKGQILSLVKLIANMQGKKVIRYAITPLTGDNWQYQDSDYAKDIETIHDQFGLEKDYHIFQGLSSDTAIISETRQLKVDILYVDGAHDHLSVFNDLVTYYPIVNKDGYIVCDDACNDLHLASGYFHGHQSCTDGVNEFFNMRAHKDQFEFVGNVVHNRIYKKLWQVNIHRTT